MWANTLEKIIGWEKLLSMIWTIQNQLIHRFSGKISDWKSVPKLLSIVKIAANTDKQWSYIWYDI
jgi:hypothetical protein